MKISVLTPSYNSGKYIQRAIDSVLNQNYTNYEHIIVDGGSNDDTIEIVKKHSKIIYVSEKDKGQSDAMNKAFKMSDGDIIVYLNADDEFSPGAFEKIVDAFKKDSKADMIVGDLMFTTDEESIKRVPSNKYLHILQYWLNVFPNNPISYFYKRKVQEKIGYFPIDDHYAMDIWFLLRVYKDFKIVKINELLGIFHSDGMNKTAVADTGYHLHQTIKQHLFNENRLMIPYFYSKLAIVKLKYFLSK